MATVRLPALVVLPAAVIGAIALAPDDGSAPPPASDSVVEAEVLDPLPPAELVAAAPPESARGSTWFCAPAAVGASGAAVEDPDEEGDGVDDPPDDGDADDGDDTVAEGGDPQAEHLVVVANAGDADATATLTVVGSGQEPATSDVAVPAASRVAVPLSEISPDGWAGAVVEVDRGLVAVDHLISDGTGHALSPCTSTPVDRAWFPSGATEPGARQLLAILNPFADEAVIAVSFETEQGARTPEDLEARVVPPRSVLVIDLGERVAVRRDVATTLRTTTGQVVVERIQSFDGSAGRRGLAMSQAAQRPARSWWFPAAERSPSTSHVVVVQNPDREQSARVEVAVTVEGWAAEEQPEPFAVDVAPGRYLAVPLDRDGRVPQDTPVSVTVDALDGAAVVAELVTSTRESVDPDGDGAGDGREAGGLQPLGTSYAMGSPVAAPRWIVPLGSFSGTDVATVSVANPTSAPVTVALEGVGDGRRGMVAEGVEIVPGGRVDIDVTGGAGFHPAAFSLEASGPVVVSRRFVFSDGEVTDAPAVAVADGVVVVGDDG